MLVGLDTGFLYALRDSNSLATKLWENNHIVPVTSVIVVYELQRKSLKGELSLSLVDAFVEAVHVVEINIKIAKRAAELTHGTGLPMADALILTSLLEVGCKKIYTKDSHFLLYKKKGIDIIML